MNTITSIRNTILAAAGIAADGTLDGTSVYFEVKEMQKKGQYSWQRIPSGRFQINVNIPGVTRDSIFRTKIADGSFNVDDVVKAIKHQVEIKKARKEAENARLANVDVAESIRNEFKSKTKYISSWASSTSSFVAPSATEGKVAVQINFGLVDPEVARKIMAFVTSLEA